MIIRDIKSHNFSYEGKNAIYADLVPNVSEEVMQASLRERIIPAGRLIYTGGVAPALRRDMSRLVAPIRIPPRIQRQTPIQAYAPTMSSNPQQISPQGSLPVAVPSAPPGAVLSQDYGKITPLLNDPSIYSIECSGAGKPLKIIRVGQRQITKIILNQAEIKDILEKIADAVHIPLLEGIFRAAVDNFSVSAVISEMIGSRFVIKKQMDSGLLKR